MRKTPPVVMRHDRHRGGSRQIEAWIHRALDVVGSALLLLVLAPLIAVTTVVILARMGSPVLFRHERAGRRGRPFVLLKFRTMRPPGSPDTGPDGDHRRLTRLGRLLRATSIDELPSLVNVLRGEMSLVGPRPLPVRYLERYTAREARRHEVRPGLTGWAQVNGRNALAWDDRLDLDVWYVDHRSVGLDLRILARTVGTVLRHNGVNHANHATMPEFERIDGR
jgi:lipopolysaccharide/colanic/teichoic acid biosynthesis glycosyltransferase